MILRREGTDFPLCFLLDASNGYIFIPVENLYPNLLISSLKVFGCDFCHGSRLLSACRMKRPVQISSLADMSKPRVSCTLPCPLCPITSFSTQNTAKTMRDLKKGRFLSTGNSDGCPLSLTWAVPCLTPWTIAFLLEKVVYLQSM